MSRSKYDEASRQSESGMNRWDESPKLGASYTIRNAALFYSQAIGDRICSNASTKGADSFIGEVLAICAVSNFRFGDWRQHGIRSFCLCSCDRSGNPSAVRFVKFISAVRCVVFELLISRIKRHLSRCLWLMVYASI